MTIRNQIENVFKGRAFERPLFYSYEGGLRFELSVGGSFIHQFITAMKKSELICEEVFSGLETIPVCIKFYGSKFLISSLSIFRELASLDITISKESQHWSEREDDSSYWHYVTLNVPKEKLSSILWCACASDFGSIRPNPGVIVYLYNFDKEIIVFPYDDRGMDIVGNNHFYLKSLYTKFSSYVLDYDREKVEATFE